MNWLVPSLPSLWQRLACGRPFGHGIRLALVFALGATALVAGCRPASPAATDVDAALRLLVQTLDAWQLGESVAQLRQQTPATYVSDELWLNNFQLKKYQIEGAGQRLGTNVQFQVVLTGSLANGRSLRREVRYLVATTPAQSVARDDR